MVRKKWGIYKWFWGRKIFSFLVPGYVRKQLPRVNWAQKSVLDKFQSSRRSLKKVMVEKQKKRFSIFDYNFFQRHCRALKPRSNVFLDLIYPKKVVSSISRHILDLKIFDPEKVRNSFTFSRKMSTFPHDFGHKNFLLSNCFTSLSKWLASAQWPISTLYKLY